MTVTVDDFVMLGTTVPEPNSDGRVFVCSAGFSAELKSLVRVYPLARRGIPSRWTQYRVPLERNPKDSRGESFKVAGDRSVDGHPRINERFEPVRKVPEADRLALLRNHVVNSVAEANGKRMSLAVIHPDAFDLWFEHNPSSPDSPQLGLFDTGQPKPEGAKRFAYIPRLRFKDECGWHNLMLRDWGSYELMRKNSHDYARQHLASALHLKPSSSLLIGNFNQHRTSWLVISVLQHLRDAPTLFDALAEDRPQISDKLRREVYTRDGWACRVCGSPDDLRVDHITPHSRGGVTELGNLRTLCATCNAAKGDRIDWDVA